MRRHRINAGCRPTAANDTKNIAGRILREVSPGVPMSLRYRMRMGSWFIGSAGLRRENGSGYATIFVP